MKDKDYEAELANKLSKAKDGTLTLEKLLELEKYARKHAIKKSDKRSLVYTVEEWKVMRKLKIVSWTNEQLKKAAKSDCGFIGDVYVFASGGATLTGCYVYKRYPA